MPSILKGIALEAWLFDPDPEEEMNCEGNESGAFVSSDKQAWPSARQGKH